MKYADIKNILYKSIEIQQIPDKWDESIPFFCKINKEDFVAFLYWTVSSTLLIKRLIGVNRNTGEIIVLEANDLSKLFGLSYGAIKPVIIDDYEKYFSAKMQYEKLFCKICDDCRTITKHGQETLLLFQQIVGTELFEQIFIKIAEEFISKLSQGGENGKR
jgi:hypothetical protein